VESELSTDTVILVFYLNTSVHFPEQVEQMRKSIPTDVATFFVPTNGETKIECINPKMITGEEYVHVKKILDECQSNVNSLLLKFSASKKINELFSNELGEEDTGGEDAMGYLSGEEDELL